MTPEERAVIDAARQMRIADARGSDLSAYFDDVLNALEALDGAQQVEPAWVASTFLHIRTGDRLRMGAEEAIVARCAVQEFHVDNTNQYQPKRWDHWEVRAELMVLPPGQEGFTIPFQQYPSDTPVEILADPERAAQLTLSTAGFVGTEEVK